MICCDFDFVCITETWLSSSIFDSEFCPDHFQVIRSDRNFEKMNVSKGGGVLLAATCEYTVSQIDLQSRGFGSLQFTDLVCVKCSAASFTIYIFVIYIQPKANVEEYELLFHLISATTELYNQRVLLIGDFNISNYQYSSSGFVTGNSPLSSLYNFLYFCDYRQFNNIINANGRCLDLVISGFHCLVEKASDSLVNEDLHHPSLLITIKRQKPRQKSINNNRSAHKQWNFRRADYPGLYKYLTDSNWEFLNNINDVNQACSLFYDQINMALELHVPKTHRLRKSSFPPWFTAAIISNLKLKWRLLRNFRLRKSVGTYSRFKRVRSELKRDIKAAFVNYTSNLEAKIKFEPRRFWSYVNNLNSSNAIPSQMMYSDKLLTKPVDIVNAFAEHFSSNL